MATRSNNRFSTLGLALGFAGLLIAFSVQGDDSYANNVRAGDVALADGKAAVAVEKYRTAIAQEEKSIAAREKLLGALFAANQYAEAESVSRELLQFSRRNFIGMISLGSSQRQQNKLWLADKSLTRALRYYPSNTRLLTELGLVKKARGRLAEARYNFNQAWLLDPYNADGAYWAMLDRSLYEDLGPYTGPDRMQNAGIGFARKYSLEAGFYGSWIQYEGSAFKRSGRVYGLNGTLGYGREHKLDYGAERLTIDRDVIADLEQWDFTLAYANYSLDYMKVRVGGHLIESSHDGSDGGWSGFFGIETFSPNRWQAGVNMTHSRYVRFGPSLNVLQISPYFARTISKGPVGWAKLDLTGHYVQPSHRAGLPLRHYFSGESALTVQWRAWTIAGFGWAGKQAFANRGGGYTSFNVAEEHTHGYGAELKKVTGPRTALAFRYSREHWRETTGNDAASNAYLATLGITF